LVVEGFDEGVDVDVLAFEFGAGFLREEAAGEACEGEGDVDSNVGGFLGVVLVGVDGDAQEAGGRLAARGRGGLAWGGLGFVEGVEERGGLFGADLALLEEAEDAGAFVRHGVLLGGG